MNRFFTLSAAAAVGASVLFAMGMSIAQTGQTVVKLKVPGVVYTAAEHGNSISAIDLASGNVKIVSVSISPHNVQVTADGALLLAVGEPASGGHGHSTKEAKGRLLVFSANNVEAGPVASIQTGSHPAHVIVDSTARRAYVTPDGRSVYVANQGTEAEPSDTVSVIEVAGGRVVDTIRTGKGAHDVAISDKGDFVFITNIIDGTVSAIDAATRAVVATFVSGEDLTESHSAPEAIEHPTNRVSADHDAIE